MKTLRIHTLPGQDPCKGARFRVQGGQDWAEYIVPAHWSSAAVDVLLEKVFYTAPLPALTKRVREEGVPEFLWRREVDAAGLEAVSAEFRYTHERDVRAVLHRIAGGLAYHAWKAGIFDTEEDVRAFYDEFRFLLLHQKAAPELSLLAVAGIDWAYGAPRPAFRPAAQIAPFAEDLHVESLDGAGVIIGRKAPAHVLKRIRILAERMALSGEDKKICVTLPIENVDSAGFAGMKRQADIELLSRGLGQRLLETALHHVMDACDRESRRGFDPETNPALNHAMEDARHAGVEEAALQTALSYARQGYESLDLRQPLPEDDISPVAATLSVPDDFIERALTGHSIMLEEAGEERRHCQAEKLWAQVTEAVWASGAPALFFRDSAGTFAGQDCGPSGQGGLVFLPGTVAPSATLNLAGFAADGNIVDSAGLSAAVQIMTVSLEASSVYAATPDLARDYRPVAIGFTGLSALLMGDALPYDSDAGRNAAALIAALVSGAAHAASADIAVKTGAFPVYAAAEKLHLQAVKDKMSAVSGTAYMQKGVTRRPVQLKAAQCPDRALVAAVGVCWDTAYALGRETGFRHAHLTAVDADPALDAFLSAPTRGLAPETGLTRFEGYFTDTVDTAEMYGKKMNPMVPRALIRLGYNASQLDDIYFHAIGHGTLFDAPFINHKTLKSKGFHQAALDALENALKSAQHIRYAFNKWTLGDEFCRRMLGFATDSLASGAFDMLQALGFSEDEIDAANLYCCGAMTLEGAPHLDPKHLAVFDCASPVFGGVRRVSAEAQIKMQAALEAFLSGAAAHTVQLPNDAGIDDIDRLALLGWELGVKQLKLYRDGCSLLHPVAMRPAAFDDDEEEVEDAQIPAPLLKAAS